LENKLKLKTFEVGDSVRVYSEQANGSLDQRYIGPYKVIGKISSSAYMLESPDKNIIRRNARKIIPYFGPNDKPSIIKLTNNESKYQQDNKTKKTLLPQIYPRSEESNQKIYLKSTSQFDGNVPINLENDKQNNNKNNEEQQPKERIELDEEEPQEIEKYQDQDHKNVSHQETEENYQDHINIQYYNQWSENLKNMVLLNKSHTTRIRNINDFFRDSLISMDPVQKMLNELKKEENPQGEPKTAEDQKKIVEENLKNSETKFGILQNLK
jgi:hypothetical protein